MPDWLHDSFTKDLDLSAGMMAARLAAAFALGCVIAGIYRLTHGRGRATPLAMTGTLVLLAVLIAMVTLVIGNSVARAFSLVGALAIVRFRTIVEDTRDTAFVIFAVGVGMAVGAGFLLIPLVGIPFAALAAFFFRPRGLNDDSPDFTLMVRVGVGHPPDALLRESFAKYLATSSLFGTATARQGVALELTYAVRLRDPDAAIALISDLNSVEGVQGVELRRT